MDRSTAIADTRLPVNRPPSHVAAIHNINKAMRVVTTIAVDVDSDTASSPSGVNASAPVARAPSTIQYFSNANAFVEAVADIPMPVYKRTLARAFHNPPGMYFTRSLAEYIQNDSRNVNSRPFTFVMS